jgi:hypothetical protein
MEIQNTSNQFTPLQLELLKLFSQSKSEQELMDIKRLIANYYAEKATAEMDDFVNETKLSNSDVNKWANEHLRVSKV